MRLIFIDSATMMLLPFEVMAVKSKNDKVVRGRFRLGENAFPSSKDKREKIMRDVERIMKKCPQIGKKEK